MRAKTSEQSVQADDGSSFDCSACTTPSLSPESWCCTPGPACLVQIYACLGSGRAGPEIITAYTVQTLSCINHENMHIQSVPLSVLDSPVLPIQNFTSKCAWTIQQKTQMDRWCRYLCSCKIWGETKFCARRNKKKRTQNRHACPSVIV